MNGTQATKQEQLSRTAMELFMKFGFRRVSVEEICRTAGVSKMTFYKYFKNKTDLLKYLLNEIAENQMDRYHDIMKRAIPYSEKVKEIVQMKRETAEMMGNELFNDLYKNAPSEITLFLHDMGSRYLATVRNDFIQAQKDGHIRPDIRPDFILFFMNHMIDLASDQSLLGMYESPGELINEMIHFFFYGILTERETP